MYAQLDSWYTLVKMCKLAYLLNYTVENFHHVPMQHIYVSKLYYVYTTLLH